MALEVKNPPANAGDVTEAGSIPVSKRSFEEEMTTHSSILAWAIPWTEVPAGLSFMGSQRVSYDRAAKQQKQGRMLKKSFSG